MIFAANLLCQISHPAAVSTGIKRQAHAENGAAVGIDPAGSGQHGLLGIYSQLAQFMGRCSLGHPRPERPESLDAPEHGTIIHVLVGAATVRAHQARLAWQVQFHPESPVGQGSQQIRMRSLRAQSRCLGVMPLGQCLTHGRCRNSIVFSVGRCKSRNFYHFRQQLLHNSVILVGEGVVGFSAHEADFGIQCRSYMALEQVKIQPYVRFSRVGKVLQEVRRKSSGRYLISRSFQHNDMASSGKLVFRCTLNHSPPLIVREALTFFLDRNHEERVHLGGRLLQQIAVPQGERVGVHDHHSASALFPKAAQVGAIALQSPAVLHKDGLRGRCQNVESQALEDGLVSGLGKELEFGDAAGGGQGDQMGNQRSHQSLGTGLFGHRYAFDDVLPDAGAGQNMALLILYDTIYI